MIMLKATITQIKKRKKLTIAILVILGIIFFLNSKKSNEALKDVQAYTVKKTDIQEELVLSGEMKASEYAKLPFQTGGKLSYVGVKEGDVIGKGKLIASLDQRQLQKQLKKDLNDYKTTRWTFDQTTDDNKDVVKSTAVQRLLDKSQFSLDNTVLDVEIQSVALEYANIYSPISGVVINTNDLHAGMNVSGADFFEVVNPDSLYFEVVADQTELTQIKEGQVGRLVLDAYPDDAIDGTISQISFAPKEDESGTVYTVRLTFNSSNAEMKYRLGMTGDSTFITHAKKNVAYVPFNYLHEENGKKFVFTDKEKKTKKTVKTGIESDTKVEVTSGLKEGDIIYD
jgi:RND family efflux transporter MFP subunit